METTRPSASWSNELFTAVGITKCRLEPVGGIISKGNGFRVVRVFRGYPFQPVVRTKRIADGQAAGIDDVGSITIEVVSTATSEVTPLSVCVEAVRRFISS